MSEQLTFCEVIAEACMCELRSYSGRGMFGKECAAIVGSHSDCMKTIAEAIKFAADQVITSDFDDGSDNLVSFNKFVDDIMKFQTDSMGSSDIVLYWPRQEYDDASTS